MTNAPPQNPRLQRWWVFLGQLKLKIHHVPGKFNEDEWEESTKMEWEELAKEAFAKMYTQLDLRMEELRLWESWKHEDLGIEEKKILDELKENPSKLIQENMWRKTPHTLLKNGRYQVQKKQKGFNGYTPHLDTKAYKARCMS